MLGGNGEPGFAGGSVDKPLFENLILSDDLPGVAQEFFSVLRMSGYNGFVSLEMEDLTMSVEAGLQTSIDALKACISK